MCDSQLEHCTNYNKRFREYFIETFRKDFCINERRVPPYQLSCSLKFLKVHIVEFTYFNFYIKKEFKAFIAYVSLYIKN